MFSRHHGTKYSKIAAEIKRGKGPFDLRGIQFTKKVTDLIIAYRKGKEIPFHDLQPLEVRTEDTMLWFLMVCSLCIDSLPLKYSILRCSASKGRYRTGYQFEYEILIIRS